jgi:hypothetical protein
MPLCPSCLAVLNLLWHKISVSFSRSTMSDMMDKKVFDEATADDVALEQLGYQQGLCHLDITS